MTPSDIDKCEKSPTGEHVWNYAPRPDNCRSGTCRYCEQKRVFEGAMSPQTHTAAILKPAPVRPETLEKAAQIAEKSLNREEDPKLNTGAITNIEEAKPKHVGPPLMPVKDKIDDADKAEIFKRLVRGEKPSVVATAVGCKLQAVSNYKFQHKAQIREAQTPAGVETKTANRETKKAKSETDPPALEKKLNYSPAERLIIIAEVKSGGFGCSESVRKKYGLTKGQFRGYMLREDYYRQVVNSGRNTIKSMRQHRAFVLSQIKHIDKVPLGRVRSLLEEYMKLLTEDLGPARGKVKEITLEMKRVSSAIEEFDLRAAACQEDVARIFQRRKKCSNQKGM